MKLLRQEKYSCNNMKTKNIVVSCKVNISSTTSENDLETHSNLAG